MWGQHVFYTVVQLLFVLICINTVHGDIPWRWACQEGNCMKHKYNSSAANKFVYSLDVCKMLCEEKDGLLWPRPTGKTVLGKNLCRLNSTNITMEIVNAGDSDTMTNLTFVRFVTWSVTSMIPPQLPLDSTGASLFVTVINKNPNVTKFKFNQIDESYTLTVTGNNQIINATITANNFFGTRHAMETLSQLFVYDDIQNTLVVQCNASIVDQPVYPYRGLLVDTARNFIPVENILATIDGMAMVKLNYFHWHLTDSQSYSLEATNYANLTKYGTYGDTKFYTNQDINDVIEFAQQRGITVVPEFDAPAHVGEGWQGTDLVICFNKQPWNTYCSEPPCGQFSPIKDGVYEYLEAIYTEMAGAFQSDIFHMGGDEVNFNCWNSSAAIQNFMTRNKTWPLTAEGFTNLWGYFVARAKERADKALGADIPKVLWSSTLTDYNHIEKYLDKKDYIIQVWTKSTDPQIQGLLEKGYQLIISNYDAFYLDCGFGAWVGSGNNWCSPYIGWQKVYDNSLKKMANNHKGILGGEVVLWSETADKNCLDAKLWPRAAAAAEVMWSELNDGDGWAKAARRMNYQRFDVSAELHPPWSRTDWSAASYSGTKTTRRSSQFVNTVDATLPKRRTYYEEIVWFA